MKKIAKKLYEIVSNLTQTTISLLSVLLFSKKCVRKNFKALSGSQIDKPLYILGNGNSLNEFLQSGEPMPENLMVLNHFASSPFFRQVKPRNYIIVDNNLCIAPETPEGKVAQERLIKSLLSVDWAMNLYMPTDSKKELIEEFKASKFLNLVLFNRTPVDGFKWVCYKLYDSRLGMPIPQNVTNAAVFCGIASGYKTIYLYGAEHSWAKFFDVDPSNHRIFLNDGHFYEKDNIRYLPKGEYMRWLKDISTALYSHYKLRSYADYCHVRVINKTKNSFVEAYEYE